MASPTVTQRSLEPVNRVINTQLSPIFFRVHGYQIISSNKMESAAVAPPMKRSRSLFRLFSRRSSVSVTTPNVLPGLRERAKSFSAKPSRQRTMSIASSSPQVPQEIHDNIIRFLRVSHENGKEATCSTCLARDLSTYSLVSKNWHSAAMPYM